MNRFGKTKIIFIFLMAGLSLGYAFSLARSSIDGYIFSSDLLHQDYEMTIYWAKLDHYRKLAELNQLQYVLTEKQKFLDNYNKNKKMVLSSFSSLKTRSHGKWLKLADVYQNLVEKKIRLMDRTISERSRGRAEALQVIFLKEGQSLSREIDDLIEASIKDIRLDLDAKTSRSASASEAAKEFLTKTYLLCLFIFSVGVMILLKDMWQRQKYEKYLLKASNFKSQFLSHMSHEIRTPLNSVIGLSDLLYESPLNSDQKGYVETLRRMGESLLNIVNGILDLSKIEAGAMVLESAEFSIEELARDVKNIMDVRAREKNIQLLIKNNIPDNTFATGDRFRLQQVLLNFLGNAIKFTDYGKVSLEISRTVNNHLRFSVSDTGVGISKEALAKLFIPFHQAEASTARVFGGTGLGLTISKQIVELMGGTIKVSSEVQRGTVFSFDLPLVCKAHLLSMESKTNLPLILHDSGPKNVLIVDDVPENRNLLHLFLKNEPYKIQFAQNGQEALEKFKASPFDLVLMDVQMPILNGNLAAKAMRDYERDNHLSPSFIVALTAQALKNEQQECIDHGCDIHLSKPIRKQALFEVLKTAFLEKRGVA